MTTIGAFNFSKFCGLIRMMLLNMFKLIFLNFQFNFSQFCIFFNQGI